MIYHAWYSRTQENHYASGKWIDSSSPKVCRYRLTTGAVVECTELRPDETPPAFIDAIYMGKVNIVSPDSYVGSRPAYYQD